MLEYILGRDGDNFCGDEVGMGTVTMGMETVYVGVGTISRRPGEDGDVSSSRCQSLSRNTLITDRKTRVTLCEKQYS